MADAEGSGSASRISGTSVAMISAVSAPTWCIVLATLGELQLSGRVGGSAMTVVASTARFPASSLSCVGSSVRPAAGVEPEGTVTCCLRPSHLFRLTSAFAERQWFSAASESTSQRRS